VIQKRRYAGRCRTKRRRHMQKQNGGIQTAVKRNGTNGINARQAPSSVVPGRGGTRGEAGNSKAETQQQARQNVIWQAGARRHLEARVQKTAGGRQR